MARQWPYPYIIACYWYGASPLLLPHHGPPPSPRFFSLSSTPTEIQALIALGLVGGVSESHMTLFVYLGGDEV